MGVFNGPDKTFGGDADRAGESAEVGSGLWPLKAPLGPIPWKQAHEEAGGIEEEGRRSRNWVSGSTPRRLPSPNRVGCEHHRRQFHDSDDTATTLRPDSDQEPQEPSKSTRRRSAKLINKKRRAAQEERGGGNTGEHPQKNKTNMTSTTDNSSSCVREALSG